MTVHFLEIVCFEDEITPLSSIIKFSEKYIKFAGADKLKQYNPNFPVHFTATSFTLVYQAPILTTIQDTERLEHNTTSIPENNDGKTLYITSDIIRCWQLLAAGKQVALLPDKQIELEHFLKSKKDIQNNNAREAETFPVNLVSDKTDIAARIIKNFIDGSHATDLLALRIILSVIAVPAAFLNLLLSSSFSRLVGSELFVNWASWSSFFVNQGVNINIGWHLPDNIKAFLPEFLQTANEWWFWLRYKCKQKVTEEETRQYESISKKKRGYFAAIYVFSFLIMAASFFTNMTFASHSTEEAKGIKYFRKIFHTVMPASVFYWFLVITNEYLAIRPSSLIPTKWWQRGRSYYSQICEDAEKIRISAYNKIWNLNPKAGEYIIGKTVAVNSLTKTEEGDTAADEAKGKLAAGQAYYDYHIGFKILEYFFVTNLIVGTLLYSFACGIAAYKAIDIAFIAIPAAIFSALGKALLLGIANVDMVTTIKGLLLTPVLKHTDKTFTATNIILFLLMMGTIGLTNFPSPAQIPLKYFFNHFWPHDPTATWKLSLSITIALTSCFAINTIDTYQLIFLFLLKQVIFDNAVNYMIKPAFNCLSSLCASTPEKVPLITQTLNPEEQYRKHNEQRNYVEITMEKIAKTSNYVITHDPDKFEKVIPGCVEHLHQEKVNPLFYTEPKKKKSNEQTFFGRIKTCMSCCAGNKMVATV